MVGSKVCSRDKSDSSDQHPLRLPPLMSFPLGKTNLHLNRKGQEGPRSSVWVLIRNSFLFKYEGTSVSVWGEGGQGKHQGRGGV